jgi:cytochrome P450
VRLVKEDMVLNDRYYLKKGGVVQIAGGTIHANKDIWGEDVNDFNPQRFLGKQRGDGINTHPAAFRGFGGGKTLCPGRHFATNEVICFTAIIVRYFDLTAADGGKIRVPEKNDLVMPVHILEPKTNSMVKIKARPEEEELSRLQVVM